MAYNKYTWTDGETITASKLNHMEDGIEDSNDYGELANKPQINGVVLNGNKSLTDLGLGDIGQFVRVQQSKTVGGGASAYINTVLSGTIDQYIILTANMKFGDEGGYQKTSLTYGFSAQYITPTVALYDPTEGGTPAGTFTVHTSVRNPHSEAQTIYVDVILLKVA